MNTNTLELEPINISHSSNVSRKKLEGEYKKIKEKIQSRPGFNNSERQLRIEYLDKLMEFDFGKFLICNKGADGFWTDTLLSWAPENNYVFENEIEEYIFKDALVTISSRERFHIFQEEIQKILDSKMTLASIPCGLMRDLLTLDFSSTKNVELIGIDLDPKSIQLSKDLAEVNGLNKYAEYKCKDAWNLEIDNKIDVITSSGLNVYESNYERLIDLYKSFYKALKNNGVLITSFLTPPPNICSSSPWEISDVPESTLALAKIIFGDILELNWQNFKSEQEVISDLKKAGFKNFQIKYDSRKIFPTIIAKK